MNRLFILIAVLFAIPLSTHAELKNTTTGSSLQGSSAINNYSAGTQDSLDPTATGNPQNVGTQNPENISKEAEIRTLNNTTPSQKIKVITNKEELKIDLSNANKKVISSPQNKNSARFVGLSFLPVIILLIIWNKKRITKKIRNKKH